MTGVVPTRQHVTTRAQRRVERLVVGDVADHGAIAFDPIAQRQRRMVQILRPHHQIADLEGSLDQLVIGDSRAELVQGDRKIRVAHLTGKRLVQRTAKSSRPVHVPPATAKQRLEERQTLDVVPVGVPEDNRPRHRTARRVTARRAPGQAPARPSRSPTPPASRQRNAAPHRTYCLHTAPSTVPAQQSNPACPRTESASHQDAPSQPLTPASRRWRFRRGSPPCPPASRRAFRRSRDAGSGRLRTTRPWPPWSAAATCASTATTTSPSSSSIGSRSGAPPDGHWYPSPARFGACHREPDVRPDTRGVPTPDASVSVVGALVLGDQAYRRASPGRKRTARCTGRMSTRSARATVPMSAVRMFHGGNTTGRRTSMTSQTSHTSRRVNA